MATAISGNQKFSYALRLISSASQVGFGSIVVLAGRFVGFVLAAQVLTAKEFGVFALVQSYAAVIERLCNAQSWQLLVKRLSELFTAKDGGDITVPTGAAVAADLIGGGIAFCIGVSCLEILAPRLGIDPVTLSAAQIYCAIVFVNAHGAWAGALRAFGQYGLYASYQIFAGLGVVASIGFFKLAHVDVTAVGLLYAWLTAELAAYLFLTVVASITLHRHGFRYRKLLSKLGDVLAELRAGMGFLLSVNVSGSLRMATKEGDVLAVGAVIGAEAAGAYKIGRNLSVLPLLVTDSLYYLVYPKFSSLFARKQSSAMRSLVRRASLLGVMVGGAAILFVWIAGDDLLHALSIHDPRVLTVMQICIVATSLATATFPFAPSLVASGDHQYQVVALAIATVVFFATFVLTVGPLGVTGAALSTVAFYIAWIAVVGPRLFSRGFL